MKPHLPLITQIWKEPKTCELPPEVTASLQLPELVVNTLYRQGIRTASDAHAFMDFHLYTPASPYELPNLKKGIKRTLKAIETGERIGIWGDFDVDGQTATAVLVSALRKISENIVYHIPIRGPESHGIQLNALQRFVKQGVSLIITCDTGISEVESISWAQQQGVDVIVTDHHSLPEILPHAHTLINPQCVDKEHPFHPLPGVGVAIKFAEALLETSGQSDYARSLHDLAALGIIADIAELRGDCRFLVQSGIDLIRNTSRASIRTMLQTAEIDAAQFTEESISYALAPRMNAVGRLADANPMVEFLLSEDPAELSVTANQIEGLNARRKLLCDQVFQGALDQIERTPSLLDHPVLILSHPEWPAGVIGIVASQLVSLYSRPVILLVSPPGELMRGSARSVEGINITTAIRQQADLLTTFGGHPMAAGLSLDPQNFKQFQRGLDLVIEQEISNHPLKRELQIDSYLQPQDIDLDFLSKVDSLAPFGSGNPPLVFAVKEMRLISASSVGKTHEHLQMIVEDNKGQSSKFIWWQGSGLPQPEGIFDLAYSARSSTYKGQPQVQLEWLDCKPSTGSIPTIHLNKTLNRNHIDYRNSKNPEQILAKVMGESHLVVFQEGSDTSTVQGKNRDEISVCDSLVIWTIPPTQVVLDDILNRAQSERIIWFASIPLENDPGFFVKSIARILKDRLKKENPVIDLNQTAAKLASTRELVDLSIAWFAARGDLRIVNENAGVLQLEPVGIKNDKLQNEIKNDLQKKLLEIQAYRRFYSRTDVSRLIDQT